MHADEIAVFVGLGALVTVIGFGASRWHRADLGALEEWGLAGRRFGTVVTWFLLGGDLYTAYTFVAVPALIFGSGALGLFALPYTIIVYPLVFLVMPRLWQIAISTGVKTAESDKKVTEDFVDTHLKIGIDSLNELINNGLTVKHLRF